MTKEKEKKNAIPNSSIEWTRVEPYADNDGFGPSGYRGFEYRSECGNFIIECGDYCGDRGGTGRAYCPKDLRTKEQAWFTSRAHAVDWCETRQHYHIVRPEMHATKKGRNFEIHGQWAGDTNALICVTSDEARAKHVIRALREMHRRDLG